MDPAEIEFLATDQRVSVVPNFNEGVLYLLEGDVGPFKAGLPLEIPLWVALSLRARRKCRVLQPSYLTADALEEVRDAEREQTFFTQLPNPHLFAVAQLLLDVAMADLAEVDRLRTALKDLWDVRQAKLR